MKSSDFVQIGLYLVLLLAVTPPLGSFMAKVFRGERSFLSPFVRPVERFLYRVCGIDENEEMNWKSYLFSLLSFNFFGFVIVLFLQLTQKYLPLNPQQLDNVPFHLSFNTAISFMTNTNWQSYAGETTLSYAVQMLGLTVQNFVSAATGIAVILALIRAFTTRFGKTIGSFWTDLVRSTMYILLPLSLLFAIILVSQGVVQTFSAYVLAATIEGTQQTIPLGPAASQIAIKMIGTNGGGFFNTNSAFPFENPTPLTNFLEMFAILMIPAALTYTYGKMINNKKHGWVIFSTMFIMFAVGLALSLTAEYQPNPVTGTNNNLEGKELRFGVTNSVIWEVATTDASNGSINSMHDSFMPLSGMTALINILLGEVIFGGVGAGLYGMMIFIIITVFIAGLMVGRTPEYLGKKIDALDIKMAILAVLLPSSCILIFSAIAVVIQSGLSSLNNSGPHGLSEILYAFTSAAGNNGSAFAGINANTVFYNLTLASDMLIGRFGVIIPALVIAGSIVKKNISPASAGTFSTNSGLFIILLIGIILIIGGLTFFPVLTLGPIVEHLLMKSSIVF